MIDPDQQSEAKLSEFREGLRRNAPAFCGTAPAWIVETVLRNLEAAADRPHQAEWVRDFATGGIKFIADQDTTECDILLRRLVDLLGEREREGDREEWDRDIPEEWDRDIPIS